jgi:Flp pilus assembly pilin Flp
MLEYAAGAAIILAILYGAMNLLEGGVTNLFSSISDWATSHGDHLRNQRPNQ